MAASETAQDTVVQVTSSPGSDISPPAVEQLEVEEPGASEQHLVYPSGSKLWLTVTSLCLSIFLNGLVCSTRCTGLLHLRKHD